MGNYLPILIYIYYVFRCTALMLREILCDLNLIALTERSLLILSFLLKFRRHYDKVHRKRNVRVFSLVTPSSDLTASTEKTPKGNSYHICGKTARGPFSNQNMFATPCADGKTASHTCSCGEPWICKRSCCRNLIHYSGFLGRWLCGGGRDESYCLYSTRGILRVGRGADLYGICSMRVPIILGSELLTLI